MEAEFKFTKRFIPTLLGIFLINSKIVFTKSYFQPFHRALNNTTVFCLFVCFFLFCFVLFCFCFVFLFLFLFFLFCFVLFCFVLFYFVLFCFIEYNYYLTLHVLYHYVLICRPTFQILNEMK